MELSPTCQVSLLSFQLISPHIDMTTFVFLIVALDRQQRRSAVQYTLDMHSEKVGTTMSEWVLSHIRETEEFCNVC